mmetsp:Transcript_56063/g.156194  ORF Transcript_56063/g.156194 Transcript_56063/m.156194 type:complete len:218 (+) Transcript_56063:37-690(+)
MLTRQNPQCRARAFSYLWLAQQQAVERGPQALGPVLARNERRVQEVGHACWVDAPGGIVEHHLPAVNVQYLVRSTGCKVGEQVVQARYGVCERPLRPEPSCRKQRRQDQRCRTQLAERLDDSFDRKVHILSIRPIEVSLARPTSAFPPPLSPGRVHGQVAICAHLSEVVDSDVEHARTRLARRSLPVLQSPEELWRGTPVHAKCNRRSISRSECLLK